MSEFTSFPGLIPDTIDLSAYLEPEESISVKPASHFAERTLDALRGKSQAKGLYLPWPKTRDLFAIRRGELTLWTGFKGHGKSMLISQIFLHAMVQEEKVLIISPEFRPEGILLRKVRQAACTSRPAEPFARRFLKWAGDNRLWLFDHQGSLKPETVTGVIRYAVENHGVTQVLVDSLMKCGIAPDDYGRQKSFVDSLQSIAHQSDIHVHLVAHARKGENDDKPARLHDVKGASELCDMAENVLSVWKNKKKLEAKSTGSNKHEAEPDAMLIIDSQRNGDGWTGSIRLWYDPESFQFLGDSQQSPVGWASPDGADETVEF